MYALKRITAYLIDNTLIMFLIRLFMPSLFDSLILRMQNPSSSAFAGTIPYLISAGLPVLVLGTLVGLFGKTPGKLLMSLKVVRPDGTTIGLAQGILREILKAVSFSFIFGAIWALYGIVTSGKTFYDVWLGCEVEDQRPPGLTETQRNWRKVMKSR